MGKPPPTQPIPKGRRPRIAKLIGLALHFAQTIRDGRCADMNKIAVCAMITQPRITHVMNLLHQASDIHEELLFLPRLATGRDRIHKPQLRRVCAEPNFFRQRRLWETLKRC